jgi:predicted dehydrogenase
MAMRRQGRRGGGAERTVGYAVMGLGHIAQVAVLPAFEHARERTRLAALVSGDPRKRKELSARHGVPAYRPEDLEDCLAREDVDALYIATPNTEHVDPCVRAARAGVHVFVEKPMATSEDDCWKMIRACEDAGVKLMVAYRLHFEPANLEAVEAAASGRLGEPRYFTSTFTYQVEPGNVRTKAELGGGAIWDLGVYCINAARYLFRAEPTQVMAMAARPRDRRFKAVEAGWSALLRFPGDRLASFTCAFDAAAAGSYRLLGSEGELRLDPAYEYVGDLERTLTVHEKPSRKRYPQRDQFAAELDAFARCVLEDREPEPDGLEGLADVRTIEAILRSARDGRAVEIEPVRKARRPTLAQAQRRPPVRAPPEPVRAQAPSQ